MTFTTLNVGSSSTRGWIELAVPQKRNALSSLVLTELAQAARWFDDRPEVKVVVVSGQGKSFSAGADLASFTSPDPKIPTREAADLGRVMGDAIEAMNPITVAKIHGHCVGGGLVLAAACDLRIAADNTYFSIPEIDLGIPLAWGGIPRLVREIGPALTKELVLTCRPFTPEEAKAAGFLNDSVPENVLASRVEELVETLVAKSSFTMTSTKQAVNAVMKQIAGTGYSWSDADALASGLHDPESRAVAAQYLKRFR